MIVSNRQDLHDEDGAAIGEFFTVGQNTNIIADGPLANAFSMALNQLYKREKDPITGVALETQAMDAVEAKRQWLAAKVRSFQFANDGTDVGMAFGVKEAQATHTDLIDVVDSVASMNDTQRAQSAVIIEGVPQNTEQLNMPGLGQSKPNPVAMAIESFARDNGVAVYKSFEDFVRHHGV